MPEEGAEEPTRFEARLRGYPPLAHPFWALIPTVLLVTFMGVAMRRSSLTPWRWSEGLLGFAASAFVAPLIFLVAGVLILARWRSRRIELHADRLRLTWGLLGRGVYEWRLTPDTRAKVRLDGVFEVTGLTSEGVPPQFGVMTTAADRALLRDLDALNSEELLALLNARPEAESAE